jgi:hypothetical protein
MQPNYYAIIPASVRYDKRIKANAKLLYGEITALSNQEGFCWSDNNYFALLYDVDHKTISRWISQLENFGYLRSIVDKINGNSRKIFINEKMQNLVTKKSLPSDKKVTTLVIKKSLPSDKIVTSYKENNTINNTINKEGNSLSFFKENFPSQFDVLMMQYKKQIKTWDAFVESFEATVEQEGLAYEQHVISGRFKKYAGNWIRNQDKFESPKNNFNADVVPAYMKKNIS